MELGDQLLQYLLSGLSTGAIYALIGIGFSIIYNATGIINFAQGEFVMLGGMLTMFLISALKLPLWAAVPLAVLLATLAVCCSSGLPSGRLKNHLPSLWLSFTIGGAIFIRGLAMLLWGKDTHAIAPFSGEEPILIGGATLLPQHLWIFGITIVLISINRWFFNHTISGKAMRACSCNARAAGLVGIDVRRMVLLAFMISAAMAPWPALLQRR